VIVDGAQAKQLAHKQYDALIVGAGAVGIPLAVRLARGGLRVLLVEAGGDRLEQTSQAIFNAATQSGRYLPGLTLGRFRVFGGTANFWGGQLVPFEPIVFGERPWVPGGAWPLSRADLASHYLAASDILNQGGLDLEDEQIWAEMATQPPEPSETVETYFSRWLPEPNLGNLFRAELAGLPSLDVVLNAPVTALHAEGEKLTGVTVALEDGGRPLLQASRIILANGTIEISRLLQLPLSDGSAAPWAGNAWLGRAFMDHVDLNSGTVTPLDRNRFNAVFDSYYRPGAKYLAKLKLTSKAQQDRQLLGIAAHFMFKSSVSELKGDLKILLKALSRGGRGDWRRIARLPSHLGAARFIFPMMWRYIRQRRMYNVADQGILLRLATEQRPLPESRITLGADRDRYGMPVANMDWRVAPETFDTIQFFAKEVADYLQSRQIARVDLDRRLLDGDPTFLDTADDGYHQMGGARMAASAEDGVVDAHLRVHGTRNLFVAGAAVYPSSGFANPTFTAIALGMRLAHDIENGIA
jgi:choline dehydrogenase-like flavoprotein